MSATRRMADVAAVVRSKNAGALLVTMDLIFDDDETFRRVRDSGVITPRLIAELYRVSDNEVAITAYAPARAIKITLPRLVPSGSPGDSDVYGAQQHAPLLDVEIPWK